MPAKRSADANHCFQPFQPSSELVEKVEQPNQPMSGFFPKELKKPNQQKLFVQIEHDLASILLLFLAGWRSFHGHL